MDFDKILLNEPRLISMIYDAYHLKGASVNSKNNYWYKVLKPKMVKLVGFSADNQELNSTGIYDKTYRFFIDLMEI